MSHSGFAPDATVTNLITIIKTGHLWYSKTCSGDQLSNLISHLDHRTIEEGNGFKLTINAEMEAKDDASKLLTFFTVDLALALTNADIEKHLSLDKNPLMRWISNCFDEEPNTDDSNTIYIGLKKYLQSRLNESQRITLLNALMPSHAHFLEQLENHENEAKNAEEQRKIQLWTECKCDEIISECSAQMKAAGLSSYQSLPILLSSLNSLKNTIDKHAPDMSQNLNTLIVAASKLHEKLKINTVFNLEEMRDFTSKLSIFDYRTVTILAKSVIDLDQHLPAWIQFKQIINLLNTDIYHKFFTRLVSSLNKHGTMGISHLPKYMELVQLYNQFFSLLSQHSNSFCEDDFIDYANSRSDDKSDKAARTAGNFYRLTCTANANGPDKKASIDELIETLKQLATPIDAYFKSIQNPEHNGEKLELDSPPRLPRSGTNFSTPTLAPSPSPSPKPLPIKLIPSETQSDIPSGTPSPEDTHRKSTPSTESKTPSPDNSGRTSPNNTSRPQESPTGTPIQAINLREVLKKALSDIPYWKEKVNFNKWYCLWIGGKSMKIGKNKHTFPTGITFMKSLIESQLPDDEVYRLMALNVKANRSKFTLFGLLELRHQPTINLYNAVAWLLANKSEWDTLAAEQDDSYANAYLTIVNKGLTPFQVSKPKGYRIPDFDNLSSATTQPLLGRNM